MAEPEAAPATSEDIRRLSDRIDKLEEAIRVLAKQFQQAHDRYGTSQEKQ
jgi:hypothetical protein